MLRFEKLVTFASLAGLLLLLLFSAGFAYRHYRIWPTDDLIVLKKQLDAYAKTGVWGLTDQFMPADVRADEPRMKIHNQTKFSAGYRAILGYEIERGLFSVRLFDGSGAKIHTWPVDHPKLAGRSTFNEEIIPHGMEVFADGSIAVNFDRFVGVIARIDPCGDPIWKNHGLYHHSIHADDDGGIWTWLSPDDPSGQQQSIVRLDAQTGETLLEISLEKLSQQSPENALTLGWPEGFSPSPAHSIPPKQERDLFHPNDIEPLTAEFAPYFDMFEKGDLLISIRNINLVAVLDPDTLVFKWKMSGPWIQQHDPDFTRDGTIQIFDNASGRGRSQIVSVDPRTNKVSRVFGANAPVFYSATRGKHQRLPSGASLITLPKDGRVIEISQDGELIFEFNNIAADGTNAVVMNSAWLPDDFFETMPTCSQDTSG